jgi:hypothetical protein
VLYMVSSHSSRTLLIAEKPITVLAPALLF